MISKKFCPECGIKIEEGWRTCPSCATDVTLSAEEQRERYVEQQPQPKKTNWKPVGYVCLGMILTFVFIIIVAGFFVANESSNQEDPDPVPPIDPPYIPPTDPDPPASTYQDTEFVSWIYSTNLEMMEYQEDVSHALNNNYYYLLETYAETAEDAVDDYMNECITYSVSSTYTPLQNEFYEYLSDVSWAYFHTKWAAKYMQSESWSSATDSFNDATEYTNKAVTHLNTVTEMMGNL